MKRTNIFLTDDQREGLQTVADYRETTPAAETREAIDAHLIKHRAEIKRGPKLIKTGKGSK